ncbi:putative metabotropic glutamate receptor 8 [Apostichopus japonicus]|uniref:Putative metabotropic glutamate receptor 8 n=1 Tax=Stichopus japonicus TaxID=307972 RepID=A0A2G8KSQ3_STIJA|nr:putative metabotropic glutamate receptor 8 [Apostichopus japonicus]
MNTVNMNYVYLVSTESEESTLRANLFLDTAAKTGVCVSQHYRLNDSVSVLDEIYRSLFSSTVKTVVVLTEAGFFRDLAMKAANHSVSDLQFIVTFDLFLSIPVGTFPSNIATVYSAVPDSLDTSQGDDEFDSYFKNLNPTAHSQEANPWFQHFWESSYDCSFDGSEGSMCDQSDITEHMTSYQRNPFVAPVIDSVDAHVQALKDVLECDEGTCDELPAFTQEAYLARLKQVDFASQVGNNGRVAFKPSGDPEDTRFQVMALNNIDGQKYLVTEWSNGLFDAFTDFPIQASQCEEVCLDPQCFPLRLKEGEAVVSRDCNNQVFLSWFA